MAQLTQRETEILKLILEESSSIEIAQKLEISKRTVDSHRHNIWKKSEASNLLGLYRFALLHKIVTQ